MDYGLLSGLAEGIKSGVASYQDTKRYNDQLERQKKADDLQTQQAQLGLIAQNAEVDPITGKVGLNHLGQQKQASELSNYDPNSAKNQFMHNTAEQFGAKNLPAGLIAPDYDKVLPTLEKSREFDLKTKELGLKRESDRTAKTEKENEKRIEALKNDLDPNKARGGNLAANQKQYDKSSHLLGLIGAYNDKNLDSRETEELAIGLQSLLSQGNPAAEQVKALVPQSAVGDIKKFKEWLLNEPEGKDQQAFIERMEHSIQRQRDIYSDQIKGAQIARLSGHQKLKESDPQTYNNLLSSFGVFPEDIERLTPSQQKGLVQQVAQGHGGSTQATPQQDADATKYAQMHNLPYEQAKAILDNRRGQNATAQR